MYHQKTLALDNKNVAIETTVRDATEEFNDYCEGDSKNMIILLFFSRMKSEQSQPSLTCLSSLSIMVATHTFLWEDVIVVILWLLRLRDRGSLVYEKGWGGKRGNLVPMYDHCFHFIKSSGSNWNEIHFLDGQINMIDQSMYYSPIFEKGLESHDFSKSCVTFAITL